MLGGAVAATAFTPAGVDLTQPLAAAKQVNIPYASGQPWPTVYGIRMVAWDNCPEGIIYFASSKSLQRNGFAFGEYS
jgi:hypothetical protein